jgi:hypothetical protein
LAVGEGQYLPFDVYSLELQEPDESMTHQRHSAALWGGAEEHDPELPIDDIFDVFLNSSPGRLSNRLSIIIQGHKVDRTMKINLNFILEADG